MSPKEFLNMAVDTGMFYKQHNNTSVSQKIDPGKSNIKILTKIIFFTQVGISKLHLDNQPKR